MECVRTLCLAAALVLLISLTVPAGAQAPAQIDHATPRAQNGLTLLAVTRGDAQGQYTFPVPPNLDFLSGPRMSGPPGGIGLWVRGPKPPAPPAPQKGQPFHPTYFDQRPQASARALNGDALPAQAETQYGGGYYDDARASGPPAPLFFVSIPGGYPVGYPAIDIDLHDAQGHAARWRLIKLAAPFHALAPPVAVQSAVTDGGVALRARAWQENGPPFSNVTDPDWTGVRYDLSAAVPAGSRWLARIRAQQLEWDAVRPGELEALQPHYPPQFARRYQPSPLFVAAYGLDAPRRPNGAAYAPQGFIRTPYARYNHFLRLKGDMAQMAAATETVTFHNLRVVTRKPPAPPVRLYAPGLFPPKRLHGTRPASPPFFQPPPSYEIAAAPQTITTPSGLSVTLLPLSTLPANRQPFGYGDDSGSLRMLLRFSPAPPAFSPAEPQALTLPRSPLYQKYHKPVSYTLQAQKPYYLEMFPDYSSMNGMTRPGQSVPVTYMATLRLPYGPPIKRTLPDGRTFMVPTPPVVPAHLDSLAFTLTQQVELKLVPFSLTVPVAAKSPLPTPLFRRPPFPFPPGLHRPPLPFPSGVRHAPFPVPPVTAH